MNDDLSFVSTDDLISELMKRSNAGVVSLILKTDDDDEGQAVTFRLTGGPFTALGLMHDAMERITARHRAAYEDDEDVE